MHSVSAVLSNNRVVSELSNGYENATAIELSQDIWMVPIIDELIQEITDEKGGVSIPFEEFEYLNDSIVNVLTELSELSRVMYFETEYFGGEGGQSSVVLDGRKMIYGPKICLDYRTRPINDSLKLLGVNVLAQHDEFDEIGLGNNRSTEKWYLRGNS